MGNQNVKHLLKDTHTREYPEYEDVDERPSYMPRPIDERYVFTREPAEHLGPGLTWGYARRARMDEQSKIKQAEYQFKANPIMIGPLHCQIQRLIKQRIAADNPKYIYERISVMLVPSLSTGEDTSTMYVILRRHSRHSTERNHSMWVDAPPLLESEIGDVSGDKDYEDLCQESAKAVPKDPPNHIPLDSGAQFSLHGALIQAPFDMMPPSAYSGAPVGMPYNFLAPRIGGGAPLEVPYQAPPPERYSDALPEAVYG